LVISPTPYNRRVGLALFCPLTSQVKGYPFEVLLPSGLKAGGAVLADQVKSLDWRVRQARFFCKVPQQGSTSQRSRKIEGQTIQDGKYRQSFIDD